MTTLIHLPDLRAGYVALVDQVVRLGTSCAPRGIPIIECTDVTFTVADVTDTLPIGVGRELSTTVAALEALQLIGAASTPDLLVAAAPQFANYRESDGRLYGAYGERVVDQLWHVYEKLRRDRDTRQAIITLWDPARDNDPGHLDYPCTVALGFRIRHDRLDLSVLMRSNDVWLGVAYDVFQFTQLQWTLAHELEVEPGRYTHTAWSMHMYERDLPRVAKLRPPSGERPSLPRGLAPTNTWDARDLARELLWNPDVVGTDLTLGTDALWYLERTRQAHARLQDES